MLLQPSIQAWLSDTSFQLAHTRHANTIDKSTQLLSCLILCLTYCVHRNLVSEPQMLQLQLSQQHLERAATIACRYPSCGSDSVPSFRCRCKSAY